MYFSRVGSFNHSIIMLIRSNSLLSGGKILTFDHIIIELFRLEDTSRVVIHNLHVSDTSSYFFWCDLFYFYSCQNLSL